MNSLIRSRTLLSFTFVAITILAKSSWAEWKTYQHDNARSGATNESAPSNPQQIWHYQSPVRPTSAWDEPALWDGWAKVHNLTNRQTFDKAFHVAVDEESVYFGSSVDDKVYCLDTSNGETRWQFFTEGPVRLAPTVNDGKVYFGSDDGNVYCLAAKTGELIWRHHAGPSDRRIPGNGRIISPWAIRTGVVISGDRLFCGAGVIPSENVFVCALDVATGNEIWKTAMNDLPAQGYLLASLKRLYVVTSRDRPVVFDAENGKRLKQVDGGAGGTFALLTGDTLLYGPGKTGQVNLVGAEKQDVLASFSGHHMIVAKPLSYLLQGSKLSALDREGYVKLYGQREAVAREKNQAAKKLKEAKDAEKEELTKQITAYTEQLKALNGGIEDCVKWTAECDCKFSMVLAGNTLIAGGDQRVLAFDSTNGKKQWTLNVTGKVYGLAVSGKQLFVSTDEGAIHCFAQAQGESVLVKPSVAGRNQRVRAQEYVGAFVPTRMPPPEIHGPFAEFVESGSVRITWDTTLPATSKLEFGTDLKNLAQWLSDEPKKFHEFVVDDVQRDLVYRFRIGGTLEDGTKLETEAYQFDSHFDYTPTKTPARPSPYADTEISDLYDQTAKLMIDAAGVKRGYALILGSQTGQLAYHLAKLSDLKIVIIEPDSQAVRETREALDSAGLYGTRVSVHQRSLDEIPYGPFTWNLIVSDRMLGDGKIPGKLRELSKCVRPSGGAVVLGTWNSRAELPNHEFDAWRQVAAGFEAGWQHMPSDEGDFWLYQRKRLARTGDWTHQYASPDNSACSQDDRIQGAMMVQWWGRPGARPMPDRGNRNPAPVSANGRLFVQGNRTLFGLDAYNGTILWSKQIPTMRRANMPRDSSNMVATEKHVLVSIGGVCVAFDAQTGERDVDFRVPESTKEKMYDWGYLASDGATLFGSGVRRGSNYMGDKGEWYEGFQREQIARVTSDYLFATDQYTGQPIWNYKQGVVLNSTITIAEGRIFFIESRNEKAKSTSSSRMLDEVLEGQVLVAIDATTGERVWEKPYDFSKCKFVTYLTYGNGTLLVTGTDRDRNFHTYAFDASDGKERWQHTAPDQKGHHTGQLSHPTIVGNHAYFNKHTYDLKTGEVISVHDFNWHGCGVMSASKHSVFSRYEYHGMYDLKTQERTEFLGIRSGCWLSLIPSGGLLLAPETSAGCSCGHSLQTSIAYVPKQEWQIESK